MAGFNSNHPPNSRLFILCPSAITEAELKFAFEKFGIVEDCFIVKDKATGKPKGKKERVGPYLNMSWYTRIAYVKFSKASDACKAMEELDNKPIFSEHRPIKVKMSSALLGPDKRRETEHECFERLRCAFVRVPEGRNGPDGQPLNEESMKEEFSKFGNVIKCTMTKNKASCYVAFEKASQCALAIEECDKEFAAVFVDPDKSSLLRRRSPSANHRRSPSPNQQYRRAGLVATPSRNNYPQSYGGGGGGGGGMHNSYMGGGGPSSGHYGNGGDHGNGSYPPNMPPQAGSLMDDLMKGAMANNPTRCTELYIKFNCPLSREHAFRLFNLVPGLDSLEYVKTTPTGENSQLNSIFLIRYATPASAGWAWEKLQDLEYPPGSNVRVRYADAGFPRDWDLSSAMNAASSAVSSMHQQQQQPEQQVQHGQQRVHQIQQLQTPQQQPPPSTYGYATSNYPSEMSSPSNDNDLRFLEHQQSNLAGGGNNNNDISRSTRSNILNTLAHTLSAAVSAPVFTSGNHQNYQQQPSTSNIESYQIGQSQCSVKLSYPKAMLPKSTPYEARLFFLCSQYIPNEMLEDAFSSFGDLINVYTLNGKNCGYIMYANRRSAECAMAALQGATLGGAKLKIMPADPEPGNKRPRMDNM